MFFGLSLMEFSDQQIKLATELKAAGLPWQPQQGQYIFDMNERIKPGSPFQKGVYYLLDFDCFVDYFGSPTNLAANTAWLPTFEEARSLLKVKITHQQWSQPLRQGTELEYLYGLLLTELKNVQ